MHFQNFSALFQGALSTSFPSGKYHCKAKSLSKTISRLRHIIAKGNKVSMPGDASHTALFSTSTHYPVGSPTLKSQNFDAIKPHKYTVSCGDPVTVLDGFVRRRVRVANLAFDQTNSLHSFVCLLLVCSFSPKVQKYLLGTPSPIKRREFDEIVFFSAGSENPSVRVAHCTFEITLLQAIMLTLLLVCAFSPRVHSIPRGPLNPKKSEF